MGLKLKVKTRFILTKGTAIHGQRCQRLVGQKLTGKVKPRYWDCGSMSRKLDSRWALIQENETDLIFVDENEIIYPKRINVDKKVTQTQHFIELLALSCGQYAQCRFVDDNAISSDFYDETDGAGAVVFVCCICVRNSFGR